MLAIRSIKTGAVLTVVDSVAYSLVREGSATWLDQEAESGGGEVSRGEAGSQSADDVDDAAVREWAHANDIPVNSRGRVPKDLVERYRARGKAGSASS